jgi:prephenate dehydrogenase
LAVVGTGLIGTSVALAARRRGVTVFLSDRDEHAAHTAAARGAGVVAAPDEPADLAVVAVPPSQVGVVLADCQRDAVAHWFTDVASVKAMPERDAARLMPEPRRYAGGHPMAGGERSGPSAARAGLFVGRPWVLTPSSGTDPEAVRHAAELAELCGATPVVMPSRAHDEAVALTSHVPHLIASLMAARLADGSADAAEVAGRGLRDVTRIAAGDPALWADIVSANAPAIADVLRSVQSDLARLIAALSASKVDGMHLGDAYSVIVDLLARGVAGVNELTAR